MTSNPPIAAPEPPVPGWLTAPVLRIAIPESPFAARGAVAPVAAAAPIRDADAADPLGVAPPGEPLPKAAPEPDAASAEIAAVRTAAPEVVEPVIVGFPAVAITDRPPDQPKPPPAPAAPRPEPAAPPVRQPGPPPDRIPFRWPRARPAVGRPQRRTKTALAIIPPPRKSLAERLARVSAGGHAQSSSARPADVAAAEPARPVLAAAAVPETRPLAQNRRLYRRVMLTAELEVDGVRCRLVDLSIGGFAAAGAPKLTANTVVPVTLRMNIDGIDIGTRFSARIVYGGEARSAGRFVELTGAQAAFLRYVVTWRGETVGAIGTTTLLDAITRRPEHKTPGPAPAPAPPPQKTSRWARWFGRIPLLGRRA